MAKCSQLMIQEPACKVPKYLTNDFEEPYEVQAGSRAPLVHCYAFPLWRQICPFIFVFNVTTREFKIALVAHFCGLYFIFNGTLMPEEQTRSCFSSCVLSISDFFQFQQGNITNQGIN